MSTDPAPLSPCISICVLDDDDICQGCYRSAAEITEWSALSDSGKRSVIEHTLERRRQAGVLL